MEKITVNISAKGEIAYEVQGVKGAGCKQLTKAIDALAVVRETKNNKEFCELPVAQQQKIG